MSTYFHATGTHYPDGDDLLSMDELSARDILVWDEDAECLVWAEDGAPVWKWDADEGTDSDAVSLTESLSEAEEILAGELGGAGRILVVELDDDADVRMGTNREGYPIVYRRIPAQYIRAL